LISRKRCTRAQHPRSDVTIELSRALRPLIFIGKRAHARRSPLRNGVRLPRAKLLRISRR
jgi:hypothetical protein